MSNSAGRIIEKRRREAGAVHERFPEETVEAIFKGLCRQEDRQIDPVDGPDRLEDLGERRVEPRSPLIEEPHEFVVQGNHEEDQDCDRSDLRHGGSGQGVTLCLL